MSKQKMNMKKSNVIITAIISITTILFGIIFMFLVNNHYTAATMTTESNPYEVPGFEEDEALEESPYSNNTYKNNARVTNSAVSEFKINTSIKAALSNTTEESDTQATNYMLGDVDRNGEITIADATQIQKMIAFLIDSTSESNALADVNADNKVNILDATLIQMYCSGLIDSFVSLEPTTEPTIPIEGTTTNTETSTSVIDSSDLPPKAPIQDGEWGASVKN
ncbi:MAG: dockerin type I repeat-containing protein [Ruminococcus sp.]